MFEILDSALDRPEDHNNKQLLYSISDCLYGVKALSEDESWLKQFFEKKFVKTAMRILELEVKDSENSAAFEVICFQSLQILQLLGNLGDDILNLIIDSAGVGFFSRLIYSKELQFQKKVASVLMLKITGKSKTQVEGKQVVAKLIDMDFSIADNKLERAKALFIFYRLIIEGSRPQLYYLLQENLMELFLNVLNNDKKEELILRIVLKSIVYIMKRLQPKSARGGEAAPNPLADKIQQIGLDVILKDFGDHPEKVIRGLSEWILSSCCVQGE